MRQISDFSAATAVLHLVGEKGPLAQLVERLTLNQDVAGSNPARPAIASASDDPGTRSRTLYV